MVLGAAAMICLGDGVGSATQVVPVVLLLLLLFAVLTVIGGVFPLMGQRGVLPSWFGVEACLWVVGGWGLVVVRGLCCIVVR